jgi:hypothetical protein
MKKMMIIPMVFMMACGKSESATVDSTVTDTTAVTTDTTAVTTDTTAQTIDTVKVDTTFIK